MKTERRVDVAFLIIVLVYCVYAGLFIYRTSFVIDGERYFTLFDDAMISMRYARNFAEGHGLVWNAGGERVEGYTNLLWTLYMSALHRVPVAQAKTSLLVQVSSALFLLLNLIVVRKLVRAVSDSRFVLLGAVIVTAFYLPLNGWSLQGMEVGLLTLMVSLTALLIIRSRKAGAFSVWPYVILCVSIFVRPDMAAPYLVLLVFLLIRDGRHRSKHFAYGLTLLLIGVAGQTAFRFMYYGEFFPNSYYLKMVGYPIGFRITRGIYVALVFLWRMNWILFLVPLVMIREGRKVSVSLLLCIFLGQIGYSIYVGGDAWESWGGSNRYICIAMPCFFVAFFCGLGDIGRFLKDRLPDIRPDLASGRTETFAGWVRIGVIVLSFVSFNAIAGIAALPETWLLKKTLHVDRNEKMVKRALVIRKFTKQDARIAVVWDGAIPYFADRPAVSILGKCDKTIAHGKMRTVSGPAKLVAFYPGHLKWDYAYSIGELKPDVVVQLWQAQDEAEPHLQPNYIQVKLEGFSFHLLKGSPSILWDRVWNLATR